MDKTSSNPNHLTRLLPSIILAAAAVAVRIPFFHLPINRDSGLFAYGGWRILHGALPYADFWDNKLPGVFYINALAIRLLGPTAGGIALFQIVYGVLTVLAFYAVARRFCGVRTSLICGLALTFYHGSYGLVESGNYTESYIALPALLAVLVALGPTVVSGAELPKQNERRWLYMAVAGALGACAALIKQPAASVIAAIAVFVLASQPRRQAWKASGFVILGAAAVAGAVVTWMAAKGILADAIQANLLFNRLYFIDAYTNGLPDAKLNLLAGLNLVALPLVGAVAGIRYGGKRDGAGCDVRWLLVPWLLLDMVGLAMGGRFYNHYFAAILPSSMLLCALFVESIRGWKPALVTVAVAAALTLGPVWSWESPTLGGASVHSIIERERTALNWISERRLGRQVKHPTERVAAWICSMTGPNELIYVWGWDTRIAFLARRAMPSRYLHTHPLGATGFNRNARISELAADLRRYPPRFIVDGGPVMPTTAPPLTGSFSGAASGFFRLDGYEPIREIVAGDYRQVTVISGYPIYELKRRRV